MSESLFPEYDPTRKYQGAFYPSGTTELAYRTTMIEGAMREDSVAKIAEAIERGWISAATRCFDGSTPIQYAQGRGFQRIAEYLIGLGWPTNVNAAPAAGPPATAKAPESP